MIFSSSPHLNKTIKMENSKVKQPNQYQYPHVNGLSLGHLSLLIRLMTFRLNVRLVAVEVVVVVAVAGIWGEGLDCLTFLNSRLILPNNGQLYLNVDVGVDVLVDKELVRAAQLRSRIPSPLQLRSKIPFLLQLRSRIPFLLQLRSRIPSPLQLRSKIPIPLQLWSKIPFLLKFCPKLKDVLNGHAGVLLA